MKPETPKNLRLFIILYIPAYLSQPTICGIEFDQPILYVVFLD